MIDLMRNKFYNKCNNVINAYENVCSFNQNVIHWKFISSLYDSSHSIVSHCTSRRRTWTKFAMC